MVNKKINMPRDLMFFSQLTLIVLGIFFSFVNVSYAQMLGGIAVLLSVPLAIACFATLRQNKSSIIHISMLILEFTIAFMMTIGMFMVY